LKIYGLLHTDFKQHNKLCRFFIVIDYFRHIIININFALLYKHTLAQLIILSVIQVSLFILLIFSKPFEIKLSYYITIAFEILINIAVVSSMILYFLDKSNNLNT